MTVRSLVLIGKILGALAFTAFALTAWFATRVWVWLVVIAWLLWRMQ